MEHWKRRQMRLNYVWDLTGFGEEEEVSWSHKWLFHIVYEIFTSMNVWLKTFHSHAESGIELLFKTNKCASVFQKVENVQSYYFSYSMIL